jgi:hypothetical protein
MCSCSNTNSMCVRVNAMLLTLELTGDDTQTATRTFKLQHGLSFTKCTLQSVEMSVRGEPLSHDWTDSETGAYPDGVDRTVYAPIYLELGGLYDSANVQTFTSNDPSTLVPVGATEGANGVRSESRLLVDRRQRHSAEASAPSVHVAPARATSGTALLCALD